jgi:tripartite-type tricarboxylate transporter receptor subunit TctC
MSTCVFDPCRLAASGRALNLRPGRRRFLGLATAFVVAGAGVARGQSVYPNRTIRIVIPFAAGAISDVCMRMTAERLAPRLGQQIVIDNQPGPGGIAAARTALAAPRDGHVLEIMANSSAVAVSQFKNLGYDPLADFVPVSGIIDFGYVISTNVNSRFRTLADLLDEMRQRPGAINVGTTAAGTSPFFMAELLKIMADVNFAIVPYRGSSEITVAMLRNDIDAVIDTFGAFKVPWQDKRARPLATTGLTRLPMLPDVPTADEQGVVGFDVSSWNGLFAPAGAPPGAVARLTREISEVLADPDLQQRFRDSGAVVQALPPDALTRRLRGDIERWARLIEKLGIPQQ